ncbi:MAG: response regulator [Spirochaetales bacterium]|nr:response regulator [Spirochaetales bacterium]
MPVPLSVLILEDRQTDLDMIVYELKRAGFDPLLAHAVDAAEYASRLNPRLDVILADYSLPQFDALAALKILQERNLHTPFIVVTGSISEEAAVACLKAGATDYLLKDRLARLGPAITQALAARKNLEAKLAAEDEIRRRNRELTVLNRVIAVSTESADEHVFLQTACDELAAATGALCVLAFVANSEHTRFSVIAERGAEPGVAGRKLSSTQDPMGRLLANLSEILVLNDADASGGALRRHGSLFPPGTSAAALFPIHVEGAPAGGLALTSRESGHFTDEHVAFVRSVADQLSNALSRVALERERLRLIAAIEQAMDAVVLLDTKNVISYANPAFERVSGYGREEALGRLFPSLFGAPQESELTRILANVVRRKREWRGRLENRKKTGEVYTVDMSISPIRDKSGTVVSCVSVQRDITEELALEARFRQAHKMEAVGRLAGGVAHDFNNLLTAIMGYANIIAHSLPAANPEQADVSQIRRAAERAGALTRQLLAFSRKQVFQPQVMSLNTVVRDMERMLRPVIGEDVDLVTDLDNLLGPVRADPGQIEQVVMNLAINARDAMPSGGRITLSTRNEDMDEKKAREHAGLEAGPYAVLSIADTGTGLSEEVLAHLFEPFFTTKEEGKGTGLGLATVYGIVKQSGGHIEASSRENEGTTFVVRLPRLPGEVVPAPGPDEVGAEMRGTECVLLVEDNVMVNDLIRKVLAYHGYDVMVAAHPSDALELVANSQRAIDLLITDMVMPGMGGRELAEKITAERPGIKVLFISGYTDTSFIYDGAVEPGRAFLQKPFSPRALARTVREVLDD